MRVSSYIARCEGYNLAILDGELIRYHSSGRVA